jgi:Tol biopolymer transport system component
LLFRISTQTTTLTRRHFPLAVGACLNACRGTTKVSADAGTYDAFHTPQDVSINGYTGDAMEPFLTRDGRYLLFNNRNDSSENTNLHWARRVDDLTFSYLGEIPGVNTPALEGVPSIDRDGNLYFVSTRSYKQTSSTIYRAKFIDGVATTPELVEGISRRTPGWVNFDAEISADGNTLYFVDGYFGSANQPQSAILVAAARSGKSFRRLTENPRLFSNVNSDSLQYAPDVSADELELFFTRVKRIEPSAEPAIFRSVRDKVDQPFSIPQRISAIQGFAEAPTLSPDGRSLYYHARVNRHFRIRRVTR